MTTVRAGGTAPPSVEVTSPGVLEATASTRAPAQASAALVGPPAAASAAPGPLIKAGKTAGITNGGSALEVYFDEPFPDGCVLFGVCGTADYVAPRFIDGCRPNLNGFSTTIMTAPNGYGIGAGQPATVDWIVVGYPSATPTST